MTPRTLAILPRRHRVASAERSVGHPARRLRWEKKVQSDRVGRLILSMHRVSGRSPSRSRSPTGPATTNSR